ncbi:nuclear transport factor 2 family protein [Spectribacter hydrogenoxidans]|uniref:Nuclear transport factor 2 family protein n=1 Tax=Spectribacter hydrogenoxidans TaxID=3075608 RepID=A0ABU3C372_9GAMM|nr:nuclear transport factor 2 family protein [Salinisphaera sp. W335]MDT0636018.1 nuclear transport factor 2 family protein [Salinisphaera sp. W335]
MPDSFCKRFEIAWHNPTAEKLVSLLTEDVVLYQPHRPPLRGRAAVRVEFSRLLAWLPGTYSKVMRWLEDSQEAFIEHELHFPAGSGFIRIPAVDRFILEDGLAKERVVYFDRFLLFAGVLRHPSLWPGYVRYRFGGSGV